MNDFQRFHKKALILLSGSFIVLLLGCGAAVAAGQSWLALLLLPGGGFGMRAVYRIQCRRYDDRQNPSRSRGGSAGP